jgi:hypothetical protein
VTKGGKKTVLTYFTDNCKNVFGETEGYTRSEYFPHTEQELRKPKTTEVITGYTITAII